MNGPVRALAIGGTNLYAAGAFLNAGQSGAQYIAKWNGSSWSTLGAGVNGSVNALAVMGDDLYVGGNFTSAGYLAANYFAKWNGSAWAALDNGMCGMNSPIMAMAVSETNLYAAGDFTIAGNIAANHIAKWNGTAWSSLGMGRPAGVNTLAVSRTALYAYDGYSGIWMWNGLTWTDVRTLMDGPILAMAVDGANLYAAGEFNFFQDFVGHNVNRMAKWDGVSWFSYGTGNGLNGIAKAILNAGAVVYVGGDFTVAGGLVANRIACWNKTNRTWSILGSGMNGSVNALTIIGSELYAGGEFTKAGGVAVNHVAKWNGSTWSGLGSGINGSVYALTGNGTDLYAGGNFITVGGATVNYIARWNGIAWYSMGLGMNGVVNALAMAGSDLYAGGAFSAAGGNSAKHIARWDGSWHALKEGMNSSVNALATSGTDLYVGGASVAKWNGNAWTILRENMSVSALALNGSVLFAGGSGGIAMFNSISWERLAGEVDRQVFCLATSGSDLYVGGDFYNAGGHPSVRMGMYRVPAPIANQNAATVRPGQVLTLSASELLENDVDPNGAELTLVSVSKTSTQGGMVSWTNGNITYIPPQGFSGTDTFGYFISNNQGGYADGFVSVEVAIPIDQSPQPDSFIVNADAAVSAIKVQADGKILAAGETTITNISGKTLEYLARFNIDGSPDAGFNYTAKPGFRLLATALEPSGTILIGGGNNMDQATSTRLASNGTIEGQLSFCWTPYGDVTAMTLQKNGEILVAVPGWYLPGVYSHRLYRLSPSGFCESMQCFDGNAAIRALAMQADEKILVGGQFVNINGRFDSQRMYFVRLNSDLSLDPTFALGVNGPVYATLVQPDGKILVAGWFGQIGGEVRSSIARLNPDGSLDKGFFTPYHPGANGPVRTMALQTDGKILVGGEFTTLGSQPRNFIARLNSDGSLDYGFNPSANGAVSAIAVQADGKILVGGNFTSIAGLPRNRIARLHNTEPATSITILEETSFTWRRGGAGPELWRCLFETSVNGTNWSSPMEGFWIDGGWKTTNLLQLTTPYIRARGFTGNGDIMETIWQTSVPITVIFVSHDNLEPGYFTFRRIGSELRGQLGGHMAVDVSPDLIHWSPLPLSVLNPLEKLFVDPNAYDYPHRFYRLRPE